MTSENSRRDLLRGAAVIGLGAWGAVALPGVAGAERRRDLDPWRRARVIEARVRRPRFPRRFFDIRAYGAEPDSQIPCTEAIAQAIEACCGAGGGHVIVPAGDFLTGPIHLRSGVDLHVAAGARLRFSTDPDDYLPAVLTRFEGVELFNYSPLIYAHGQQNIAVTGAGVLDGQASDEHWWPWKGKTDFGWEPGDPHQAEARERLFTQAEDGVAVEERVYGEGDCLRSSFIEPYACRDVLIEGVTIVAAPMWQLHPTLCTDVLVQNVTFDSHGPNNDGCNPESSQRVVIRGCSFDTGDDCIAIKAGRNADGRRVGVPSEDIVIADCEMRDGHGGVTIGSEMSGGVRRVFARDCEMSSPLLDIAVRFKTNSLRGGFIEDVHVKDLTIGTVGGSVLDIDLYYEDGPGHGHNPEVSDLSIRSTTVQTTKRAIRLRGYADAPIRQVTLSDVDFGSTREPSVVEYVDGLTLERVIENGAPMQIPADSRPAGQDG